MKFDRRYISPNISSFRYSNIKYFTYLIFVIAVLFIIFNISNVSLSSFLSPENLAESYDTANDDLKYQQSSSSGISAYVSMLQFAVGDYAIFLLGYFLIRGDKKSALMMLCAVLAHIIMMLSKGARSGLIQILFSIVFVYCSFYQYINAKLINIVKKIGFVFLIILGSAFSVITFGRFGGSGFDELIVFSLESYIGQPMLNFANYGLDANGIRYGDRTAPIIRKLLGLHTSTNFYERRETYSNMLIDDSYFYTFVGDFTLDYGPIIGFMLLFVISLLLRKMINPYNTGYKLSHLLVFYIIFQWCAYGFTLWPYAEKMGNVKLIFGLLLFACLRYSENKRYNTYKYAKLKC